MPAWLRWPGPAFSSLRSITRVLARALPPSRPEHRGALWSPVSEPRPRPGGGVDGGRGGWRGGGCGSVAGPPLPGGRSLGEKTRVRATQRGFLPSPALHLQEDGIGESPDSVPQRAHFESPSWAGSLKIQESSLPWAGLLNRWYSLLNRGSHRLSSSLLGSFLVRLLSYHVTFTKPLPIPLGLFPRLHAEGLGQMVSESPARPRIWGPDSWC